MKIFYFILILVLTACSGAKKKTVHEYAKKHDSAKDELAFITPLKFEPMYFFKPLGDYKGEYKEVGMARVNSSVLSSQNIIFDLKSHSITEIPGTFDPIGLFGTNLVSILIENDKKDLSVAFYDLIDLRKNGKNAKPIYGPDANLTGRYQSLGLLKNTQTQIDFRIYTDGMKGGQIRDFRWNKNAHIHASQIKPLTTSIAICNNLRKNGVLELKLPMMSKDGQLISGFDIEEQSTFIYKINPKSKNCKLHEKISIRKSDLGKLDFAPDGKSVLFHYSSRDLMLSPLVFGKPEKSWRLTPTLYNLKDKTLFSIPTSEGALSSYFPAHLPNGNILVLEWLVTTGDSADGSKKFQFIEMKL